MNKEKLAWLLSIGLIAVLAMRLPGSLAQRDDDYSFVRTLVDIHRQVSENYVDPPDEERLRQAAVEGMLSELDPYTVYIPPAQTEMFNRILGGSFPGVGIQIDQQEDGTIEIVSPIEGSPAFKAGILPGDVIVKVNGESVEGHRLPDVMKKIQGEVGTDVTLTIRRVDGTIEDVPLTRGRVQVPTILGYQRTATNGWDYYIAENPKIAYLRITQFTEDTFEAMRTTLESLLADGMEGLILDLRYNPGGRLDSAIQVVDMFLEDGVIVSTKGRNRPEQVVHATSAGTLPEFPMIVLVNEGSASAAEIVSGSLMDNRRALVIGEQTFGKGSVQEVIDLDGGGELKMTVAYYYMPSGRLVHRRADAPEGGDWGVMPQILVPMSPEQEREAVRARDEQEQLRVPRPKAVTQPTTAPTTQAVDPQLQRAVDTMLALLVLQSEHPGPKVPVTPAQPPTTGPVQVPQEMLPEGEIPGIDTPERIVPPDEPVNTEPMDAAPDGDVVPDSATPAEELETSDEMTPTDRAETMEEMDPDAAPAAEPETAPTTAPVAD